VNRATLIRGIQLIVAITLATFAWLIYDSIRSNEASLSAGLAGVQPFWLFCGAVLALQEGVLGGLRIWSLARVLCPTLPVRTAIISEFVLMFCAGVTPGQAGAAPSQVAVLVYSGMRLVDVATASALVASCTLVFFLVSALVIFVLRQQGLVVVQGGEHIDWLLGISVVSFGAGLLALMLAAAYPPLLKGVVRALAALVGPFYRGALRLARLAPRLRPRADAALASPGAGSARLSRSIDEFHRGVRTYLRRGKRAYLSALMLTFAFFCSRFAVAYFILLGLGIPTEPATFVSVGPPIVQIVLIQALLNFALYLSPTPGASGIAEAGSNALMSPWVRGAFEIPYLVLWRLLTLFLCMFVGGVYVFRYLGADVLAERVRQTEEARRALEEGNGEEGEDRSDGDGPPEGQGRSGAGPGSAQDPGHFDGTCTAAKRLTLPR